MVVAYSATPQNAIDAGRGSRVTSRTSENIARRGGQQRQGGDAELQPQRADDRGRHRDQRGDRGDLPGAGRSPAHDERSLSGGEIGAGVGELDAEHHRDHGGDRRDDGVLDQRVDAAGECRVAGRRNEDRDDQRRVALAEPAGRQTHRRRRIRPGQHEDRDPGPAHQRVSGQREAQRQMASPIAAQTTAATSATRGCSAPEVRTPLPPDQAVRCASTSPARSK